jgi:hypothetical protein
MSALNRAAQHVVRQQQHMGQIPIELNGVRVMAMAFVDAGVRPTGNTIHHVAGELVGPAHALAVVAYPSQPGFYLLYCDRAWQVLTDTWHRSLAEAKEQAEFEYAGVSGAWKDAV